MMTKNVGVIGGGQLAWMMALVAPKENIKIYIQTPHETDSAVCLGERTIFAPVDDVSATAELAKYCDVITFENEFVDLEGLQSLVSEGVCFYPRLTSLSPLLDKFDQRSFFQSQGFPVPRFSLYESDSDFQSFSFPLVLKARRHGYDGQGTVIVKSPLELQSALEKFKQTPLLIEEFVPFEKELAIMAARSATGEIKVYPVVETYQKNQVCRWVIAPALISQDIEEKISAIASKLLISLDYVGILGIEFFMKNNGEVLINEVAPRTHNSGHYTLDACETSQFAMQLQAITGKKLGNTKLKSSGAVMINLLGYESAQSEYLSQRKEIEQLGAFVHWYGKTESRQGRKLGHVTVLLDEKSPEKMYHQAQMMIEKVESIWYPQR
ncbi:MAG: 5-(carboxyamino)imidazole ribonucleotide synthase [Cyanobacteria bacterium J149]|nr:MAG: 5-(carboxyamino)imidazole ribonucleotide synthase [Cyanobacteria bacterium J149]